MRKPLIGLGVGLLVFAIAPVGTAFAAKGRPPPPLPAPLTQVCSAADNGGTLVNGVCVLPDAISGAAIDYSAPIIASNSGLVSSNPRPAGTDTFSLSSGHLPPGLSMPASIGPDNTVVEGDATQAGTFTFAVTAADHSAGVSSVQTYQITVHAEPPDMLLCTSGSNGGNLVNGVCVLPDATVGQPYEGFIITSHESGGGFSIIAGGLPPGLMMPTFYGAAGTIVGGTPTQAGTFNFTVIGTDQEGEPLGPQTYSITVTAAPPLTISFPTTCCNTGTVGQSYLQNFAVSGGVGPFVASISAGALPPGIGLSSAAPFSLTGTPTQPGTFHFTFMVTDGTGSHATEVGTIAVS
jgi:hypothetical protein